MSASKMIYPWVDATRQGRKVDIGTWTSVVSYFAFFVFLVFGAVELFWSGAASEATGIPAWTFFLGVVLFYLCGLLCGGFATYYLLRCPQCGHNPTRRAKDGGRLGSRKLWAKLEKLDMREVWFRRSSTSVATVSNANPRIVSKKNPPAHAPRVAS